MGLTDELVPLLKKLRMSGVLQSLDVRVRQAVEDELSHEEFLVRLLTAVDLLIVDDLGLRPLAPDEAADLYEVIRLRYRRGALILTSNRDASELGGLFGDPLLASAAMDRLLHDAHVLVFDGDSYRNPPPARRKREPAEDRRSARA